MLNAVSQNTGGGNSPVWRILVVKDESRFADPDHKQDQFPPPPGFGGGPSSFNDNDVERVIYFADDDPAPGTGTGRSPQYHGLSRFHAPRRDARTPEEAVLTDVIAQAGTRLLALAMKQARSFFVLIHGIPTGCTFAPLVCVLSIPNDRRHAIRRRSSRIKGGSSRRAGCGHQNRSRPYTLDDAVVVNNVQVPNVTWTASRFPWSRFRWCGVRFARTARGRSSLAR